MIYNIHDYQIYMTIQDIHDYTIYMTIRMEVFAQNLMFVVAHQAGMETNVK